MSADEDTELRDLVAQTLETNGVLGKIKAQLRASVFLALDEQDAVLDKTPLLNQPLKNFMGTKEGRLVTGLVREFLEFFHLEYSLAVFEPETGCTEQCSERKQLARELNVIESDTTQTLPLLAELVKRGGGDRLSRSHVPGSEPTGVVSHNNSNSVECKNRRNAAAVDKSATSPCISPLNSRSHDVSSDPEDDSFIDDPVSGHTKSNASYASETNRNERASAGSKVDVEAKSSQMSSLAGLPSLRGNQTSADQEMKSVEKKTSDLGFDMAEDDEDYEENFESSSISTKLPTPQSARSDMPAKSIEEDIVEEIDEDVDFSVADDLLKSDHSGPADLTTDRTISPNEQSSAFDYIEDVLVP